MVYALFVVLTAEQQHQSTAALQNCSTAALQYKTTKPKHFFRKAEFIRGK